MIWINIKTTTLRESEYISASPTQQATWLKLLAYCSEHENGGVIHGAGDWNDRAWLFGCGVTTEEVCSECGLWWFDESGSLFVWNYPVEKELEVSAKREAGRRGGMTKAQNRSTASSTASSCATAQPVAESVSASSSASTEGVKGRSKWKEEGVTGKEEELSTPSASRNAQAVLEQCLPITNTLIPHPSDEVSASPPAPVPEKRKRPKFQKPSQEEWVSYATSMPEPLTENQALGAWDYYEGNGWKVGRNPMADWKATLRAWSRRQKEYLPGYKTPALPLKLNLNPDDPRYVEITEKIGEKYEDIVQMPFVSSDEFHRKLQTFLATWHGSADLFLSVYGKALEFRDQQYASKEIRSASDPAYLCDNFAKVVSDVDWMQASIDRNSKPKTFTKGI